MRNSHHLYEGDAKLALGVPRLTLQSFVSMFHFLFSVIVLGYYQLKKENEKYEQIQEQPRKNALKEMRLAWRGEEHQIYSYQATSKREREKRQKN